MKKIILTLFAIAALAGSSLAQADIFNSHFGIGAGGQIGLDYQFNAPIQLSLDVRPMWNFIGHVTGFNYGAALGIRYAF